MSILDQEKNFGSGQLIFENWSGGPVDFFLEPQPKYMYSRSKKCQDADMDADTEVATWRCPELDVRCWVDSRRSRHGESWALEGGEAIRSHF